jgi:hypothetical protein
MSSLRAAFYVKNVPAWERALRAALSVAAVAGSAALPAPWSWVVAASAVSLLVTGLVGFCPVCAMFGRRLSR